jgi:hypothetical protein
MQTEQLVLSLLTCTSSRAILAAWAFAEMVAFPINVLAILADDVKKVAVHGRDPPPGEADISTFTDQLNRYLSKLPSRLAAAT